jgi:hypothetical protein
MMLVVVILIPFAKNDDKLDGNITIFVEVEKFYSDLYFVFKLRIVFSSWEFRGREIGYYVDREVLCL